MAQRTVCLCEGKYIGIESIFTVINGKQINIPEKLEELRAKSRNKELYCPCGCGANLVLVAGDRNLKEQHFRLKDGSHENECHVVNEGKTSVDSKIVLKCWLDDKLQTCDVETRVPISLIGDTNRKYEFSFLSRTKKVAVSYSHKRVNISDEKFDILQANSDGIHLIYIVDIMNGGSNTQYPEGLMKIQNRQGYCLLLNVKDASYNDAKMCAVFYAQNNDGLWKEIKFAEGLLSDFAIAEGGLLKYKNELLSAKLDMQSREFEKSLQEERARREEEQNQSQERAERKWLEFLKQQKEAERQAEIKFKQMKCDASICPRCGGTLREKNGRYGSFIGCSNYPKCEYTRNAK